MLDATVIDLLIVRLPVPASLSVATNSEPDHVPHRSPVTKVAAASQIRWPREKLPIHSACP